MACLRRPHPGGSRIACSLAIVSSSSPVILSAEIFPTGHVQSAQAVMAAEAVRNEIVRDDWQFQQLHDRPVAISGTDIVSADVVYRETNNGTTVWRSIVSFYSRYEADVPYTTLTLKGDCEAIRMERIRDEHVLVLCRVREPVSARNVEEQPNEEHENESADARQRVRIHAIIVHVLSRSEIHRVCLLDDAGAFEASTSYDVPIFFASSEDTVAAGVWWKGLVMTGEDVRAVGACAPPSTETEERTSAKKPKKKGKGAKKQQKKDGFARGMSLRG